MFFFFNDTATTEIYTLSLHDALPIFHRREHRKVDIFDQVAQLLDRLAALGCRRHTKTSSLSEWLCERKQGVCQGGREMSADRKSTRLNSSHANISYAVFCLKKKKKTR